MKQAKPMIGMSIARKKGSKPMEVNPFAGYPAWA